MHSLLSRPDLRADVLFVALASLVLVLLTVPPLADHPVPSDDEIWIMSASHKLATEGVFGTDLFAGFYRADEVYLFNMPAHHFVLAGFFKVLGTSIFLGRLVSVFYGIATLALVYAIGKRLGGIRVGALSLAFMLLLRLNIGFDTGLPLQEMASSMRYDLAPVPFMLGAVLLLFDPTMKRVALAGALLSLATLLQFYAAFLFPVAALYLLLESGALAARIKTIVVLGVAAAIIAAPYAVYVAFNYEEFQGQTSTLERRIEFTDPDFFLTNVERESKRFPLHWDSPKTIITDRPTAKAALIAGLPAAVIYAGWVALRQGSRAHRMLFLSLAGLPLQFAVLDSQKIYFYWISVVPFLCLGIATLVVPALDQLRGWRPPLASRRDLLRLAAGGAAVVFLLMVAVEGGYSQAQGVRTWNRDSSYLALRDKLDDHVPPGARVVGATALWWAMPETEFRSYYMLFYRTNPKVADNLTTVSGYLDEFETEYLVFTRTSRMFLERLIPRDKADLRDYLNNSSKEIARFADESYGTIEVWKVDRSKRPPRRSAAESAPNGSPPSERAAAR